MKVFEGDGCLFFLRVFFAQRIIALDDVIVFVLLLIVSVSVVYVIVLLLHCVVMETVRNLCNDVQVLKSIWFGKITGSTHKERLESFYGPQAHVCKFVYLFANSSPGFWLKSLL